MKQLTSNKSFFMHPIPVSLLAWAICYIAYGLQFSSRLWIPFPKLAPVGVTIAIGMIAAFAISFAVPIRRHASIELVEPSSTLLHRAWLMFGFLNLLLILEFIYCGYIPLISMALGANISHFAFGIPSLHGFVFAGYLFFSSCGMIAFMLFRKPHYLIPTFLAVVVGLLVVSRKMFMVSSLQSFILLLLLAQKPLRALGFTLLGGVVIMLCFGVAGDLRSGSVIDDDAGFKEDGIMQTVPGADWAYMYITTPLHNLAYASIYTDAEHNRFPVRTLSPLLPSIIRSEMSGGADQFERMSRSRYWLESSMFNVSTAYLPAYLDRGFFGIFAYALITSLVVSVVYHHASSWTGLIMLATLYAANVLTVFSDNFVNLNVAGQFIWLGLIAASCRIRLIFNTNHTSVKRISDDSFELDDEYSSSLRNCDSASPHNSMGVSA